MSDEHLRMSDAERERAAAELGEHYAQGRLTSEEHKERLDRIWAARTRGELGPIFRDLPGRHPPVTPGTGTPTRPQTYWSGGTAPLRRGLPTPLLVVLVVLLVLTVVTHAPLIVAGLLVAFFVFARHRGHARRRHWSR